MPYITTNLGRIIAFGDLIRFVEKLKKLDIEEDTPVYIRVKQQTANIVDMGANPDFIILTDTKLM